MVVALFTLALVAAGGLVTGNDAALSVPDWPLSWGRLVPPLEGGIRFEFAHRVLAAVVAILTAILAFGTRSKLAWWAFATVMAQAALGGALVKLVDPKLLAISHAALAQLCFGLTVAAAVSEFPEILEQGSGNGVALCAVAAVFAQTVLGAALQHTVMGLEYHIAGAIAATAMVMWASLGILMDHMEEPTLRRPAMVLLVLTAVQMFLGFAAYTVRAATVDDPQPMPLAVWTTVAHLVAGALVFGAAIALAMISGRQRKG